MTTVICYMDDCRWCNCGTCNRGAITISEDYECEAYESYRTLYTDSYWIACAKDGKAYRKLRNNGKKIEYNGYVFYTQSKIYPNESYRVTEERTGYDVGEFRHLKSRWEKFLELCPTLPDVLSYPIYESEDEG